VSPQLGAVRLDAPIVRSFVGGLAHDASLRTPIVVAARGIREDGEVELPIDATRALLLGRPVGDHVWVTVLWCVGIALVSAAAAGTLFRRKVS
jgi:hypothetical protein